MLKNNRKLLGGFTLVELLVVITILGVLATIGLTVFSSAQARGRDTRRKSDLKQIASALELFYSDYGKYPDSDNGKIKACGYNSITGGTDCTWGSGEFRDTDTSGNTKTTYFKTLPKDPATNYNYYYRTVSVNSVVVGFQLFAHLENSQDLSIISTSYSCGNGANTCNFAITSPNVTPAQ